MTQDYFRKLQALVQTRGIQWTVKHVKACRLAVTRYISNEPLRSLEGVRLIKGWPFWLLMFKDLGLEPWKLRWYLTLLVVLRDIEFPPVLDLDPIVTPWKGTLPSITKKEHLSIKKDLRLKPLQIQWNDFHISTKKGPNGQAMITSTVDLDALPEQLITDLQVIAGNPFKLQVGKALLFREINQPAYDIWKKASEFKGDPKFRKLSCFSDKECKSRTIAIFDYWSQTALKPLHDALNGILRNISTDCTFNQNHFLDILSKQVNKTFYSFDLTNATDRMPIELQKKIIGSLIGRKKADAWARILTQYPFTYKDQKDIYYKAGQPMGAYSSWPAMALTHHYVVRLAAKRALSGPFTDYCLLGDDIVIANDEVARHYQEILKTLDIPISETKTHRSKELYEFAKRYVYRGQEISPFHIGSITSVYNKYYLLQNFLETQSNHGWILQADRLPGLITAIYQVHNKPRQGKAVYKLYVLFESISEIKKMGVINTSAYDVLVHHFGFPDSPTPDERKEFIDNSLREVSRELIQQDITKFRDEIEQIYEITEDLMTKYGKDLVDQTRNNVVTDWHPIAVAGYNRLMDSIIGFTRTYDPDLELTELLKFKGVNVSLLRKDAYSVRAATSSLLALSQMVKRYISKMKTHLNEHCSLKS